MVFLYFCHCIESYALENDIRSFLFQMILLLMCLAILVPSARLELDHSYTAGGNDDNKTWSDLGLRYRMKEPNFLMDPMDYQHCKKPAKCVKMINTTCLGTVLPYDTTSLDLMPKYTTQEMIMVSFFRFLLFYCNL